MKLTTVAILFTIGILYSCTSKLSFKPSYTAATTILCGDICKAKPKSNAPLLADARNLWQKTGRY